MINFLYCRSCEPSRLLKLSFVNWREKKVTKISIFIKFLKKLYLNLVFILSYTYSVLKIINNFRLYGFFLLNIAAYSEGDYFRNSVLNLLATFDVVGCSSKP